MDYLQTMEYGHMPFELFHDINYQVFPKKLQSKSACPDPFCNCKENIPVNYKMAWDAFSKYF